jgi:hypothetical protein
MLQWTLAESDGPIAVVGKERRLLFAKKAWVGPNDNQSLGAASQRNPANMCPVA